MIKKKGKFLTFIFSCLPGAGHMYMGLMKQGVSLMGLFFFLIFFTSWMQIGPFVYLLPILWFYSFFDCWNKMTLSDEEFGRLRDDYFIPIKGEDIPNISINKIRPYLAIGLIIIGVKLLFGNFEDLFYRIFPNIFDEFFWFINHNLFEILFALLIIWIGIRLISGKKKELDHNQMYLEKKSGEED